MIEIYFNSIERRIMKFSLKNKTDLKLLDYFDHIISFSHVKKYLIENKSRFMINLLPYMKENPNL